MGHVAGQGLTQVKFMRFQAQLALLYAGQIQNVVDETKQLAPGLVDLPGVFRPLFFGAVGAGRELIHPQDDIQGGAHVVAHAGEELMLGPLMGIGGRHGLFHQAAVLLPVCVRQAKGQQGLAPAEGLVHDDVYIDPRKPVVRDALKVAAKVLYPVLSQLGQVLQREAVGKFPGGLLMHDG